MRIWILLILFFLPFQEVNASSYWVQYFFECSCITDDDPICFYELESHLKDSVRTSVSFDTKNCATALQAAKEIISVLEKKGRALQTSMNIAQQKQMQAGYACIQDNSVKFERVLELTKKKHVNLIMAQNMKNEDVCEGLYSNIHLLAYRAQFLYSDVHRCFKGAPF